MKTYNQAVNRTPKAGRFWFPPLRSGTGYRRRYWPGICEFLAGAVQRPWHRVWLQRSSTLVIAKAGKVAVGVGCQIHRQHGYSRRAPVAGPSSSSDNRVGAVCALVPFAIRLVGASCSREGMQRWLPGETLVVTGH